LTENGHERLRAPAAAWSLSSRGSRGAFMRAVASNASAAPDRHSHIEQSMRIRRCSAKKAGHDPGVAPARPGNGLSNISAPRADRSCSCELRRCQALSRYRLAVWRTKDFPLPRFSIGPIKNANGCVWKGCLKRVRRESRSLSLWSLRDSRVAQGLMGEPDSYVRRALRDFRVASASIFNLTFEARTSSPGTCRSFAL
jgi:hypothetical protein